MADPPPATTETRSAFSPWAALIPVALLLVVSGFFAFGLTRDPHKLPSMLVDRPMPTFQLASVAQSKKLLANSDLIGRVSLVNIFGSWCSSCVLEHPNLMDIAQSGAVAVYGVDWRDKPGAGAAWLERYGDPYARVGLDADSKLAIDLGVTGAPETVLVDKQGRVRYKQVGPITPEIWRETLLPMVRQLEAAG
jgi:cytochrome c biogenesis protein CcmG/thiol:disulfide interchange protein DsbE